MPWWGRGNNDDVEGHSHTYATQEDGEEKTTVIENVGGHDVLFNKKRKKYKSVCTYPGCGDVGSTWEGAWENA